MSEETYDEGYEAGLEEGYENGYDAALSEHRSLENADEFFEGLMSLDLEQWFRGLGGEARARLIEVCKLVEKNP